MRSIRVLLLVLLGCAGQQKASDVLTLSVTPLENQPPEVAALVRRGTAARVVRLDISPLESVAGSARISIELFPGRTISTTISRVQQSAWSAESSSETGSLAVSDKTLHAMFWPTTGSPIEIKLLESPDRYLIVERTDAELPCGVGPRTSGAELPYRATKMRRAPTEFTVLVVYTEAARKERGGTAGMNSFVANAIADTNKIYVESKISQKLRLVHKAEVTYTESSSFGSMLDHLTLKSDGKLDAVHKLRDRYKADMVTLLVEDSTHGGIAWTMRTKPNAAFESLAFSVVSTNSAVRQHSFAHELGHNMGCCHDRRNSPSCYMNSYGWRFKAGGVTYRTVMAYLPGARIQRFSNPSVNYNGAATGTSSDHNVETIKRSAKTVAAWR